MSKTKSIKKKAILCGDRTSDLHWLLVDAISPLIIRRFQDPSGYVLLPSPDYVPDPVGRGLVGSAPI